MDPVTRIPIALIGLGHLGKIHARCLAALPSAFELVAAFDSDPEARAAFAKTSDAIICASLEDLWQVLRKRAETSAVAVDIVTPTPTHGVLAEAALHYGLHVFVEKPITATVAEAETLVALAERTSRVLQVGHVERFNPAFRLVADGQLRPVFIEAHRLAQFNPRALDVSVVLDLMIHDLDLVLHLVDAEVVQVSASGVAVVGDSIDIANARLDFANGATANLTASRISLKNMRKLRLFERDAYVSVDLLDKKTEIVRLSDHDPAAPGMFQLPTQNGLREVVMEQPDVLPINAIEEELRDFARAIQTGEQPQVTGRDGLRALALAQQIVADIEKRAARYSFTQSQGR